jgi:hypothetical protein
VPCSLILEDWKNSGTEITKDMFEDVGVSFDKVGAVLLFVAPLPRE